MGGGQAGVRAGVQGLCSDRRRRRALLEITEPPPKPPASAQLSIVARSPCPTPRW